MSGWIEFSNLCLPMTRMSGVILLSCWVVVFWRSQCVNCDPLSLRNRMRLPFQWSMKMRERSSARDKSLDGAWMISRLVCSVMGNVVGMGVMMWVPFS